jgi:hypothetical protein
MWSPEEASYRVGGNHARTLPCVAAAADGRPLWQLPASAQYRETSPALLGEAATARLFGHEVASFAGRLGIQHRDVPYALINGLADGGLIFSHLAHFYAAVFPERLRAVAVPGAERFGQDIAIVRTARARSPLPLRSSASS